MVEAKQLGIPVGNVIVLVSSKESLEKTCIFLGFENIELSNTLPSNNLATWTGILLF